MKKFILKFVSFAICAIMLVTTMAGCGKTVTVDVTSLLPKAKIQEGVINENSNFILSWNNDEKCVVLTDKATGVQWSTTPEGYMNTPTEEKQARQRNYLESAILVSYKMAEENAIADARAYTHSVNKGTYSAEITDGAVTVTYLFKDAEILIPVTYSLKEKGMSISIDTSKIVENENLVYSIQVAPYLCSAPHGQADSYMFYPSGSGALIDISKPVTEKMTTSSEVYGNDAARKIKDKQTNEKNVYLPVYGIKTGNNAVLAIISSGADSASINATVADNVTGYSSICASFDLRNSDYTYIQSGSGNDSELYSDERLEKAVFTVDYYPLSDANANYNGMARLYQEYLYGNNDAASDVEDSVYSLKFIGGLGQQKNFIGFPYKSLLALTTYSDISNILNELSVTGVKPNIQLYGFGESGLDISKIAGNFKLANKFGSKKELNSLTEYCKQNGIDSFVDFNISEFAKAGGGYNTFDTAKTATKASAYVYQISRGAHIPDVDNYSRHRLITRTKLDAIANKLLKKIGKYNISGVSFASITSNAYSDYTSDEYYAKNGMGAQVSEIANNYKQNGYSFAATGANVYAAQIADCIFEAPHTSSKQDMFTADIPFYQMIFKGKTEITSEAMNAGESFETKKLYALETGSSMLFTLYNNYNETITLSPHKDLYGGLYKGNKDVIINAGNEFKDYYSAISGQTIVNHELITKDVRCTTFANGVKTYVNYSNSDYTVADGIVKANDYLVIK